MLSPGGGNLGALVESERHETDDVRERALGHTYPGICLTESRTCPCHVQTIEEWISRPCSDHNPA